jgi:hypothetical protein
LTHARSPLQVISVSPMPHSSVQPAPSQVQPAAPSQFTVQAPLQVTAQLESPVQLAVEPSPSASVQVEPPAQVALDAVPTDWVQLDSPSQVEVQPLPQVPSQLVFDAQCEVQLLPQSTVQVFMCWQSKVTSECRPAAPPSPTAPSLPPAPPPSVQVPPMAQVQVVSVQLQVPLHCACSALSRVQPAAATTSSAANRVRMAASYLMMPKQVQSVSLAAQAAPVGPEQAPEQHACDVEQLWPTYEQAGVPMSPDGGGALPQVPLDCPAGTLHGRPAQQSPFAVQAPPEGEQALPQRSTPAASGRQGTPLQHSLEKVHCWPAAMQHGASPV